LETRFLLACITEFSIPTSNSEPFAIAAGPDGNLWFTELNANKIARMNTDGTVTAEFQLPSGHSRLTSITAGPDGNLWFTEDRNAKIGRITPTGDISEYPVIPSNGDPARITAGPDGNLWFTEQGGAAIGIVNLHSPFGIDVEERFPVPGSNPQPLGITAGPDGKVWFTEDNANEIASLTTDSLPTYAWRFVPSSNSFPNSITAGPDGNIWFTELNTGKIGHVSTHLDQFAEFRVPGSYPRAITTGPDGNLWFVDDGGDRVFYCTPDVTAIPIATNNSGPSWITSGPDGNLWFTEANANKIGRVNIRTTHYGVTASADSVVAGASFSLTVTAQNTCNETVLGYRGTVHFSSTDNAASLPADYTFTAADHGVHTFAGVVLRTAGSRSIVATDTGDSSITGTTRATVTPAATSRLLVTAFPSPITAGTAGSFTITAQDPYGNTTTAYRGTVHFTSTDSQAGLPGDYTFTAADQGVHASSATLKTAGAQSLTVTDTVNNTIAGSQMGMVVNAAAASILRVAGFPSPITAGASGNVTVSAKDPYGNTATTYRGTVHFTSTDGQAVLPGDYTFTAADQGVHTFSATLETAEPQSLTVSDTINSSITGTQTGIQVNPAAAASFSVADFPTPTVAGSIGGFAVTALDAFGNIATGYQGTVTFSSTDAQAVLPGNYTFTSADRGSHPFGAVLETAGTESLTATDTVITSITGTQAGIVVTPAAADHFEVDAPPTVTSGVPFDFTVIARDPYGNVDTNYLGTVAFSSMDPTGGSFSPPSYSFQPSDQGMAYFPGGVTLFTDGTWDVTTTDVNSGITGSAYVNVVNTAGGNSAFHAASVPAGQQESTPAQPPALPASDSPVAAGTATASAERTTPTISPTPELALAGLLTDTIRGSDAMIAGLDGWLPEPSAVDALFARATAISLLRASR
jgi:streptogramin lyase